MQDDDADSRETPNTSRETKPGFKDVVMSVLAAVFGVQSEQNRQRDFRKGDPGDYIAVYVALVIALVIGMIVLVNMVLEAAGT
jgi:uncharacterized membrane protein YidH (DUF202 family)